MNQSMLVYIQYRLNKGRVKIPEYANFGRLVKTVRTRVAKS